MEGRARGGCRQVVAARPVRAQQRIWRSAQLPVCCVSIDVLENAARVRLAPEPVEGCRARGTVTVDGIHLSKSHALATIAQEHEDNVRGLHVLQ